MFNPTIDVYAKPETRRPVNQRYQHWAYLQVGAALTGWAIIALIVSLCV